MSKKTDDENENQSIKDGNKKAQGNNSILNDELTPQVIPFSSDNEIKILLNEYNLCTDRIETFQNRQDTILQISIAIIGGLIAFTLTHKIPDEFYIVLPVLPIILFTHILYHYTRVIANQGYRAYIQDGLNQYLSDERKIRYQEVAKEYLLIKNPMSKVNTVIYPIVVIFNFIYSIVMSNFNITVVLFDLILLIICIIIAVEFFKFFYKLNEKVEKFVKEIR